MANQYYIHLITGITLFEVDNTNPIGNLVWKTKVKKLRDGTIPGYSVVKIESIPSNGDPNLIGLTGEVDNVSLEEIEK